MKNIVMLFKKQMEYHVSALRAGNPVLGLAVAQTTCETLYRIKGISFRGLINWKSGAKLCHLEISDSRLIISQLGI